MRGLWARLLAVGIAGFSALTFVAFSASVASAGSKINGFHTEVGPLKVQVYSQMCDRGGPNLHTRLAVKNTSSSPQTIVVHDSFATAVYDPPGPIDPGKGTLVHLTSSRATPGHTLTLATEGDTQTMTIPESPCPTSTSSSSSTSTTSTTGSSTSSTIITTPNDPSGGDGNTVTGPGVVAMGPSGGSTGGVSTASASTLPFTGSDIRLFAVLGNFLVLIGFAMLYLSHRSPRAAAFFKRLRPTSTS